MNIKELKSAIENLPDDMDVMLDSNPEEGLYSMSESASVKKIKWQSEEIPKKDWPSIDCLIISDEL